MIPTSKECELWLKHIAGDLRLTNHLGIRPLNESIELNASGPEMISTFGHREFSAMVGFLDMRGFSTQVTGMAPQQVMDFAAPFVETVVSVASQHHWLIDKSIGDEVMVVIPMFQQDATLSDVRLPSERLPIIEMSILIHDVAEKLGGLSAEYQFTAGFAYGSVALGKIGGNGYSEWTVYGNAVNAAKRLQAKASDFAGKNGHALAVGAIVAEKPYFHGELKTWLEAFVPVGCARIQLFDPRLATESLKGVGDVSFVEAGVDILA